MSLDFKNIEERINLMRWTEEIDDEPPCEGSLADVFWNHDVPALLSAARASSGQAEPSPQSPKEQESSS